MKRKATDSEIRLLAELARAVSETFGESWIAGLIVESMDDGGMGSLRLFVKGDNSLRETKSTRIAECAFQDRDGVAVLATLLAFQDSGLPYELDIWKVDFSPLVEIPNEIEAIALPGAAFEP